MRRTRLFATVLALALVAATLPAGVGGAAVESNHARTDHHGAATAAGADAPAAVGAPQQGDCTFPVSQVDATGTEVRVEDEPQRVVVLQASAAQVMWELGAQEKVVGMPVASYTAYLNGSQNRTNVVNQDGSVNTEQVVGLEPDLVLAPNVVPNDTVDQLRQSGLTVYKTSFEQSIEDIYAKVELYGRFTGRCERAAQVNQRTRQRVQTVREAVGDERPVRTLYYFYNFTAGNDTFINEVIEAAGGQNVAAEAGITGYQEISDEVVAQQDPQWVVVPSDAQFPSGEPYASTTAYRKNQTLTVNANYMNQPGPRVVVPLTKLAKAFHPEAFAEANATAAPDGGDGGDGQADGGDRTSPAATDGGGPGFTGVAAVLAVLATALVARLRRRP